MKKIFITMILLVMYTYVSLSAVMGAEIVDIDCNEYDIVAKAYFTYNNTVVRLNDNKIRYFWWTGREFLLYDAKTNELKQSTDAENWTLIDIDFDLKNRISLLYTPVIRFCGDKYIVYDAYFEPSADPVIRGNEISKQSIYIMDSNFNLIGSYTFEDPVTDFEYINGVYYLETSRYFMDENDKLKRTSQVYTSSDTVNWDIDNVLQGVPKYNGIKNYIMPNNELVNYSSNLYRFEWNDIHISNNNLESTKVEFETPPACYYKVVDDLYVTYQNGAQEKSFQASLDGVYFIEILYPDYDGALRDCHWWKDKLIFRTSDKIFEYDISEIRNILNQKCPIDTPYIKLNNSILGFETPPVIEDGSTLVPIRFLFEQMGAQVDWEQATRTATISQNNTTVSFTIDDPTAFVNGAPATMTVPARLINGKTMVPLRFLSENLGYTVDWNEGSRTAIIE